MSNKIKISLKNKEKLDFFLKEDSKIILFIMPFGKETYMKENKEILLDFDIQYSEFEIFFIEKNFIVKRVDHIFQTDINNKMFKAINSADIVIADLTLWNSNVMYELGARHSLRDKKTILIKNEIIELNYQNQIPFNINNYAIFDYSVLFSKWRKIFENDSSDSPIKKEISSNIFEDKKVFEEYINKWDFFIKEYKKIPETEHKIKFQKLQKYKNSFENVEIFDSFLALETYKTSETFEGLLEAKKLIWKHKPFESNNSEIIGLACSIIRRLYELKPLDKEFKHISNNLAYYFLSKHKTPYSYSSYILHQMLLLKFREISLEYFIENAKILKGDFDFYCNKESETEYYEHTERLINLANGKKTDYYKQKNSEFSFKTSKETYEKLEKIIDSKSN